jgi:hypothetical protein
MSNKLTIKGIDTVMKNLNAEVKKIEGRTMAGLIKAGIEIRRSMEKDSPKIPVDTSNLRSSFSMVTSGGQILNSGNNSSFTSELSTAASSSGKEMIALGFGANYAFWVHENMDANFQRPGAGPKFLETALNNNKSKIIQIIKDNVKL